MSYSHILTVESFHLFSISIIDCSFFAKKIEISLFFRESWKENQRELTHAGVQCEFSA